MPDARSAQPPSGALSHSFVLPSLESFPFSARSTTRPSRRLASGFRLACASIFSRLPRNLVPPAVPNAPFPSLLFATHPEIENAVSHRKYKVALISNRNTSGYQDWVAAAPAPRRQFNEIVKGNCYAFKSMPRLDAILEELDIFDPEKRYAFRVWTIGRPAPPASLKTIFCSAKFWRRGESNPRPRSLTARRLHAYPVPFAAYRSGQAAVSPLTLRAGKTRSRLVRWSRRRVTDRNAPASLLCDASSQPRRRRLGRRAT